MDEFLLLYVYNIEIMVNLISKSLAVNNCALQTNFNICKVFYKT
jgi:hypothetical protein